MFREFAAAAALLAGTVAYAQSTAEDQAGTTSTPDQSGVTVQPGASDPSSVNTDQAQPAGARQGQDIQSMSKDQRFVVKAASSGMFEVQSSQLAAQRAQSEEVKRFAQQMVQDHTQANQQLQQIAQQKGIQIPQQLSPQHQACLEELQQLQGKDFERAYLIDQVAEHNKAVLKFRDASSELQDPQIRQFASQTLPKLREHLSHVEQLAGVEQDATTAGSRQGASEAAPGTSGTSGSSTDAAGSSGSSSDIGSGASGSSGSSIDAGSSGSGASGSGASGAGSSGASGTGSSGVGGTPEDRGTNRE